ncbi:helix-turn-helix transcriptional regulator [Streptomyces sp. H27-C3]|uniref:helix-turn-helix transcriptional regulator n=1 Tax=Streptomyces sp. H27-C3 TaxID=3046305 RepID=UPI0024BB955D|nr:helix-turn-helix transcriptional regulator [Streptomyces sp. H27-C3]MDJ0464885.1 helix-turn-helix transcriptional regulator [Streptomyces sp. H27-C3]
MGRNDARTRSRADDPTLFLYQELRLRGASSFDEVAGELDLAPAERERCRDELTSLGLMVATGSNHDSSLALKSGERPESESDTVTVVAPETALLRLLRREQRRLKDHLAEADRTYGVLDTLADRFLHGGALTQSEVEVEVVTDYRRIQQVLADMSDTMRHDSLSMVPGSLQREIPERALDRDRSQVNKGVRVRCIHNQRFTAVPEMAEFFRLKAESGVELRLSPVVPMNMIIADQDIALIPLDPENPSVGAIVARGPALVRSYIALYEYCWHTATPYGDSASTEQGGDGLTEQQQAALRMLATGMKDEKIARSLGVSLRTVSRLLSEVMQELGASSRFEAGVRATRLGWLD